MRASLYTFCVIGLIFIIGSALPGRSQEPPQGPRRTEETGKDLGRVKHEKSWWTPMHPKGESPETQMAYADSLKTAGSMKAAMKEYCALVYTWPESAQAPAAQFNYAQILEQRGELEKAFNEYQFLVETYPGFCSFRDVLERQYNIADKVAGRRRYFLLFRYEAPEEAIPLYEKMIQSGLQWKKSSELQFRIARIYEKTEQYDLAIDAYALYHQRYPMGPLAEQAFFGQAKCCYLYAKNNRNAADLRENAAVTLKGFLDWYPRSGAAAQARRYLDELEMESVGLLYQQAQIYLSATHSADGDEGVKKCLVGAKISFQRLIYEYPSSRWADTARARIKQIDGQLEKIK